MSNRLPVFDVFRNSFRYMLEHYRILSLFCIFSFWEYICSAVSIWRTTCWAAHFIFFTPICSISFCPGLFQPAEIIFQAGIY